jgi:hypothetical protein
MGFKVTRDYVKDKDEKGQVGNESIRQTGFNAMFMSEEEQEQCEYHGGKIRVRLRDDDGNIHYHGVVDDIDFSAELFLNWGMSFSGAVSLDLYKEDWDKLTDNREHPYLSKDGKWYSFMG